MTRRIAWLLNLNAHEIDRDTLLRAYKSVKRRDSTCYDAHDNVGQIFGNVPKAVSIAIVYAFLSE